MKNIVSSALLIPFESLINQFIAQDIKLSEDLKKHDGKVLEIEVRSPTLNFFVFFYESTVRLSFVNEVKNQVNRRDRISQLSTDGKISGSASALLGILLDRDSDRSLVNPDITITGDSEFIQEIQLLFANMEIDWQEPLSKIIGDIPTHSVDQLFNKLFAFARDSARAVTTNIDEYLHEESRMVPPLNQVEMFDQDLDSLKLKLDRLTARLQIMHNLLETVETGKHC